MSLLKHRAFIKKYEDRFYDETNCKELIIFDNKNEIIIFKNNELVRTVIIDIDDERIEYDLICDILESDTIEGELIQYETEYEIL
jgi:hypothetical protein